MGHYSFKTTELYINIKEDDFYNIKNPLNQYYRNNLNSNKEEVS